MGVSIFRDVAPKCFGSFDRALSSMIRLTAGETWLDELVLLDTDTGELYYGTALFVFSYIVVVVWILLQVSVAVLLVTSIPSSCRWSSLLRLICMSIMVCGVASTFASSYLWGHRPGYIIVNVWPNRDDDIEPNIRRLTWAHVATWMFRTTS